MRSKIFIRADGNRQIGLGHIVRCIALAQMLQENFNITFFCKEVPEKIINEIENLSFGFFKIESEDDFLNLLTDQIIVIVDHYGLDTSYQSLIKRKGCKLICIDDLHNKLFFADIIINHAPNIEPSDYKAQLYTQYVLGLDYVLLRPAFLERAKNNINFKAIQTAFVCFGGADIKNITQIAVEVLKNDARFKKIIVVTGLVYSHFHQLNQSVKNDPRFFFYQSVDPDMMVDLIAESQLAIVPASGILQEVLAVGCKIVSGMYVQNQKYVFENYKALGAFESAEDFSHNSLIFAINESFENGKPREKFIDGYSKDRIFNIFNQLSKEDSILLKMISKKDIAKTFEWANNAEIRKFSFNKKAIEFAAHEQWFTNKINNINCFYYLGWLDDVPIGSIRFDIENNEAKISYLVDPAYQGKGLGTILLKKGLEVFLKQLPENISILWGEVFNENLASVKIFKRLGYKEKLDPSAKFVRFEKIIQK
jgi:UDP-2,4-diacetamido-2,4,6-trideoxy-beta-L-altropyranose hydrolase